MSAPTPMKIRTYGQPNSPYAQACFKHSPSSRSREAIVVQWNYRHGEPGGFYSCDSGYRAPMFPITA
ncbi:MAG: hypothetical protein JWL86_318 [Rhizobium sp.]|nr:hypothetical protein [Rhizobium sp.]